MNNKKVIVYTVFIFIFLSCKDIHNSSTKYQNVKQSKIDTVLFEYNFETDGYEGVFVPETEADSNEVSIKNGYLDINVSKGATIWFKEKLTAPVKIEYTAIVVDNEGSNDRISDLNCFFMAIDPRCPSNIFSCSNSIRNGVFGNYHKLRTYYVGYGGNDNSTTRMRRYPGYTGERPMLPEHDLGQPHLIKSNVPINISIEVNGNHVTYSHDDKIIFELLDRLPYHEGWFAFRTVRNHLRIQNFKISKPKLNEYQ